MTKDENPMAPRLLGCAQDQDRRQPSAVGV